jgi:hypothetical protein
LNLSALMGEDSQATLRITTLRLAPEGSHRPHASVVPQFELGNGTEDHVQQKREEAVVGDVINAPQDPEDHKNELYPWWEFIYGP